VERDGLWAAVRPVAYTELEDPSSLYRGWRFPSPFRGLYSRGSTPLALYLVVENRGRRTLTFNAGTSFALFWRGEPLLPVEYDDLYQNLGGVPDREDRLIPLRAMLFGSYQSLRPGRAARGLLLFRRPDPWKLKAAPAHLVARRIFSGSKEITFTVPLSLEVEELPLQSAQGGLP